MILLTFRSHFIFLVLFLLIGFCHTVQAQEEYEEWKENYLQEFEEFQNEHDKEFYNMLREDWEEFALNFIPDAYQKPKPDTPLKVNSPDQETNPKAEVKIDTENPNTQAEVDNPSTPEENSNPTRSFEEGITTTFEPNVEKAEVKSNSFNYYDVPINYKYYSAFEKKLKNPLNNQSISSFWKHLATKDYSSFLKQVQQVKDNLSLNDYAYGQLLMRIGKQIYSNNNETTLFTWFMLKQSGFSTRIGFTKSDVFLLTQAKLNGFHFTSDGVTQHILTLDGSEIPSLNRIYTYDGDHPGSNEKVLDLSFETIPQLPQEPLSKNLNFTYDDTTYTIEVSVNKKLIEYYDSFPEADFELYFTNPIDQQTHQQLIRNLKPLVQNRTILDKVNLLLRFVQRSFDYKTDQKHFNVSNNSLFPEETIYYPYSDCEDRAILFGYLIRQLTDLEYVVLLYPRHLTLAIHFPDNPPSGPRVGDPIMYNGKEYYMSDPTYMGADAGMVGSSYADQDPKIFKYPQ